jgi:hypothetical protein
MLALDPRDLVSRVNEFGEESTLLQTNSRPCRARRQGAGVDMRIAGSPGFRVDGGSFEILLYALIGIQTNRDKRTC